MELNPFVVTLIGFGTVFAGLVVLIALSWLMSFIIRNTQKKSDDVGVFAAEAVSDSDAEDVEQVTDAMTEIGDRDCFDAIVASAIATYAGVNGGGIRIRSIKYLGESQDTMRSDRGEFVAAVSAAVANVMGADVSGLRIHSIKKI